MVSGQWEGLVHRLELQQPRLGHHLEESDEVLDCSELMKQLHAPRVAPAVEGGAPARLREHRPEVVDAVLALSVATEVAAEVVLDVRGHDLDVARVQPCNR